MQQNKCDRNNDLNLRKGKVKNIVGKSEMLGEKQFQLLQWHLVFLSVHKLSTGICPRSLYIISHSLIFIYTACKFEINACSHKGAKCLHY